MKLKIWRHLPQIVMIIQRRYGLYYWVSLYGHNTFVGCLRSKHLNIKKQVYDIAAYLLMACQLTSDFRYHEKTYSVEIALNNSSVLQSWGFIFTQSYKLFI